MPQNEIRNYEEKMRFLERIGRFNVIISVESIEEAKLLMNEIKGKHTSKKQLIFFIDRRLTTPVIEKDKSNRFYDFKKVISKVVNCCKKR